MERIHLMKWLLDVDLTKTRDFYSKEIDLCNCLYCQNYYEACKHLESSVMDPFKTLGMNPLTPSHLSEFGEVEGGFRLYTGSYHIVGTIVDGELCTDSDWNDTNTATLENFTFGFKKELQFVHDEMPLPVLQMDFEARIPWLLDENPED
ncbi:hypothetical protein [Bacillus sinesaloumensis]|uniref:hypothetical protein n=1 Tax=Litchfieldia sinesaloumensis TaxID=1926280 RepID=UPI0009887C25|nr:hypothetical protein [Bacillus sinesaloumensis]